MAKAAAAKSKGKLPGHHNADAITGLGGTGGQDLLDIAGFGNAGDFGARVSIVVAGYQTIVTIDGSVVITLQGVDGNGDNLITSDDFLLGP